MHGQYVSTCICTLHEYSFNTDWSIDRQQQQQQQLYYLYSAKYIGIWSNALYITMLIMLQLKEWIMCICIYAYKVSVKNTINEKLKANSKE